MTPGIFVAGVCCHKQIADAVERQSARLIKTVSKHALHAVGVVFKNRSGTVSGPTINGGEYVARLTIGFDSGVRHNHSHDRGKNQCRSQADFDSVSNYLLLIHDSVCFPALVILRVRVRNRRRTSRGEALRLIRDPFSESELGKSRSSSQDNFVLTPRRIASFDRWREFSRRERLPVSGFDTYVRGSLVWLPVENGAHSFVIEPQTVAISCRKRRDPNFSIGRV